MASIRREWFGARGRIVAAIFAVGCNPGPPQESATGPVETTGSTTASSEGGAATTGGTGSSGATTGGTGSTGETTGGVSGTTGDASATAEGTTTAGPAFATCGEETDTGVDPVPADVAFCVDPQIDWLEEHLDCALDCSDKTLIHGEGPAASLLMISQITFDIGYGPCGEGLLLRRLFLGHPSAPKATVSAYLECGLDPWIGAHAVKGRLADGAAFTATLTIEGYAGDWVSPAPVDPPRLFGAFAGDLVGPFEATHCAMNDGFLFACE